MTDSNLSNTDEDQNGWRPRLGVCRRWTDRCERVFHFESRPYRFKTLYRACGRHRFKSDPGIGKLDRGFCFGRHAQFAECGRRWVVYFSRAPCSFQGKCGNGKLSRANRVRHRTFASHSAAPPAIARFWTHSTSVLDSRAPCSTFTDSPSVIITRRTKPANFGSSRSVRKRGSS